MIPVIRDVEYTLTFVATMLAVIVAIFDRTIWFVLIGVFYVIGLLWGTKILHYAGIYLRYNDNKNCQKSSNQDFCRVCGGNSCNRHKPSLHNNQVKVPKDFDHALQKLLEKLLQTYVCTWYTSFSANPSFVHQIRLAIGTAVRDITGRLFRSDTSEIIFSNLIPIALQHARDWKALVKFSETKSGKPEDWVAEFMGQKIHPAAYSRDSELNYLRGIVTALLPQLLSTYISTNNKVLLREVLANWVLLPAIDALADPENINTLIELCTHHQHELSQEINSVHVPILYSWVTPILTVQGSQDPLKPSLEEVLNDPQLLYLFMQHIKETGPVNLLQFCLDIDDLSKRMLNPEITPVIEEILYVDALNIYSTYLDPDGSDYLHLPAHISQGMQEILEGGPGKIQELRTSRPLYQAHQEAHALLEAICLPSFHHSHELYKMLCGLPASATLTKSSSQMSGVGGPGVGARLSNQLGRIRGALRAAAVDGAPFHSQDVFQAEEVDCSPRTYGEVNFDDEKCHDLTTWRVTVPHVDGGGSQPLYMVAVHSVAEDKSWTVLRRDQDFYALRARLMEFHGDRELNDSPLPTRKNTSLISNRQRYQDFLQKLLAKPTLRSSELLHAFLTLPNLKPHFTNFTTPDIGILYQSMAHKLRKEKGQHLDKFMTTFLASTHLKYEHVADLGVEPINDHSLGEPKKKGRDLISGTPFGDNLHMHSDHREFVRVSPKQQHVQGASFCIAEAVESMFDGSYTISRIIWLIASLSRSSLDPVLNTFLRETLIKLLSDGRAASVVKLLHNTIFGSRIAKSSNVGKSREERHERAKEGLHNLMPWWCFGFRRRWCRLMDSLLDPLQSPSLNKHLAYTLLDQIIANLYPEISQ
ncbi:sorting nexin-14-like isoform X2 [Venturia canescens]|uniref:sorting nexin-14-like isoform X2 n=1 Tax=Venturia canescens TaxID=32260 RepID=UPI001C9D0D36|nr:sorting nexin-14-like isoform X2 [Venturia canescens]